MLLTYIYAATPPAVVILTPWTHSYITMRDLPDHLRLRLSPPPFHVPYAVLSFLSLFYIEEIRICKFLVNVIYNLFFDVEDELSLVFFLIGSTV